MAIEQRIDALDRLHQLARRLRRGLKAPCSILRNGTTPRSISAVGTGMPSTSPFIVRSNRIAPIILLARERARATDAAAHVADQAEHFLVPEAHAPSSTP